MDCMLQSATLDKIDESCPSLEFQLFTHFVSTVNDNYEVCLGLIS